MVTGDDAARVFALRLPPLMRTQAQLLAANHGVSLNRFILMAIEEKVQRYGISLDENSAGSEINGQDVQADGVEEGEV